MKKRTNIAVLLADLFEDREFWYPYLRMREADCNVVAVAAEKKMFKGKSGTCADADKAIDEVSANQFDAVIIPGGYSPDLMRREPKMVDLVKNIYQQKGIAAAICHGPWMLISADIIKGRQLTSFYAIRDDVENAGAEWIDAPVVVDQRIITSRIPDDLPIFCRTFLQELDKENPS